MSSQPADGSEVWSHVTSRRIEYEGEVKVALIRVLLVTAFYAVQLTHFLFFSQRNLVDEAFQRQATYLSAAWLFISLAVLVVLSRRWLPAGLKYVTAGLDIVLLTAIAAKGSGPASPMVFVFALTISMAALRGSLPLIWFATLSALVGYFVLVGLNDGGWFISKQSTPPVRQMVVALTLAATGMACGQLVRLIRQIVAETVERQLGAGEPPV